MAIRMREMQNDMDNLRNMCEYAPMRRNAQCKFWRMAIPNHDVMSSGFGAEKTETEQTERFFP